MANTQIDLDAAEMNWLRKQAKLGRTSVPQIIHDFIRQHAGITAPPHTNGKNPPSEKIKARFPWIGLGKGAPATDATLAEHYLYGEGEPL